MAAAAPVIFFGDSICFGEKVGAHHGWVTRLAAAVETEFGERFLVANSSINGNTTRMALERMPFDVQRYAPQVLLVQFGLNDCNYWQTDRGVPRVSPRAFEANLHEILDRGLALGARALLLNTNHPTTRRTSFEHSGTVYEEGNRAYNEIIRRVAADRADTALVDIERAWNERIASGVHLASLLLADELHLSRAGHDAYVEIVGPPLLETLRGLA